MLIIRFPSIASINLRSITLSHIIAKRDYLFCVRHQHVSRGLSVNMSASSIGTCSDLFDGGVVVCRLNPRSSDALEPCNDDDKPDFASYRVGELRQLHRHCYSTCNRISPRSTFDLCSSHPCDGDFCDNCICPIYIL